MSSRKELVALRVASSDLLLEVEQLPTLSPELRKATAELAAVLRGLAFSDSALLTAAVGQIARLGSPVQAILGKSRERPLVLHRQFVCAALRQGSDLSFPAIGRLMQQDQSTIQSSVSRVRKLTEDVALSNHELRVLAEATRAVKRAALSGKGAK